MPSLPRVRHKLVTKLGQHPSLFHTLMPLRTVLGGGAGMAPLTRDTELVIDGFYRSANGFAIRAFLSAQPRRVKLANRTHVPATIIRAVEWNIPALVLIREPKDVAVSYTLKWPYLSGEDSLREYVAYYNAILPYRSDYVVASFDEVTTEFGHAIARVNERFNTKFALFQHNTASVRTVTDGIQSRDRAAFGDDVAKSSLPSPQKEALSLSYRKMLEIDQLQPLIADAEQLYRTLSGTATDQSHQTARLSTIRPC